MALETLNIDSVNTVKILIVGPAGIGKTSTIRTIADQENKGKVCVLSAESGLLAVRSFVKDKIIEGWEVKTYADLREAYGKLTTDEFYKNRYEWVFIDSLTEISSRVVEAMKNKYPAKNDSFNMWGDYNDTFTMMIKAFRDIKHLNVVFTCLETVEKDDLNRRYVAPAIAGTQAKERLASYFDEVFYMTSIKQDDGSERRVFITQQYDRFPAKDRSGKLDLIEEPNLEYIRDKILNENHN